MKLTEHSGEDTTVNLLRGTAELVDRLRLSDAPSPLSELSAALRSRADRLEMYVRMTDTPGANEVACAAVLAINAPDPTPTKAKGRRATEATS